MEVELSLHPMELAATIEALYEALLRRMKWTLHRKERMTPDGWGDLDFEIAQSVVNQLAAALAKGTMLLRELDDVHPEFEEMFTPPQEMWDLINQVTLASVWAEAPVHSPDGCQQVCQRLAEV